MSGVTFPLIPRRRVLGLPFGGLHSARRGVGSDVAGSRPYEPGDDMDRIDWNASARLSLARGSDEFVVREHYAEEAPRVVVLCDRRPSMALFPERWPWLRKPEAIRHAVQLIGDSAVAARGLGLEHVPLLCAREIPVPGALARVIRVLVHCYLPAEAEPRHVYLREAQRLRADLEHAQ